MEVTSAKVIYKTKLPRVGLDRSRSRSPGSQNSFMKNKTKAEIIDHVRKLANDSPTKGLSHFNIHKANSQFFLPVSSRKLLISQLNSGSGALP